LLAKHRVEIATPRRAKDYASARETRPFIEGSLFNGSAVDFLTLGATTPLYLAIAGLAC